jgi:hypothetical protein
MIVKGWFTPTIATVMVLAVSSWSPCRQPRMACSACWISSSLPTASSDATTSPSVHTKSHSSLRATPRTVRERLKVLLEVRARRLRARADGDTPVLVVVSRRARLVHVHALLLQSDSERPHVSVSPSNTAIRTAQHTREHARRHRRQAAPRRTGGGCTTACTPASLLAHNGSTAACVSTLLGSTPSSSLRRSYCPQCPRPGDPR